MSKEQARGRRRATQPDAMAGLAAAGGGNVDKIRDILFGAQMRDYSRRFSRLEESLERALADLRGEVDGRLQALETFTRSELAALDERLRAESAARTDEARRLTRELESTERALQQRVGELSDRTSRAEQSLRQQLLDLTRSLRAELREQHVGLTDSLDRAVEQLEGEKVDRTTLAGLFSELALRLDDGFAALDLGDVEAVAEADD